MPWWWLVFVGLLVVCCVCLLSHRLRSYSLQPGEEKEPFGDMRRHSMVNPVRQQWSGDKSRSSSTPTLANRLAMQAAPHLLAAGITTTGCSSRQLQDSSEIEFEASRRRLSSKHVGTAQPGPPDSHTKCGASSHEEVLASKILEALDTGGDSQPIRILE